MNKIKKNNLLILIISFILIALVSSQTVVQKVTPIIISASNPEIEVVEKSSNTEIESKIYPTLLEIKEQNPEKRINVIIIPASEKPTYHIVGLCSWCNTIAWLCQIASWLCGLFCGTDFELEAITSDGYIIGSLPAKNIDKLAQSEYVKAVIPDDRIAITIQSTEFKIKRALAEMEKDVIVSAPTITGEAIVTEKYQVKIISVEKPKFLNIIPIFWAEPEAKIKVYKDGVEVRTTTVNEGSSVEVGSDKINIISVKSNTVEFDVNGE